MQTRTDLGSRVGCGEFLANFVFELEQVHHDGAAAGHHAHFHRRLYGIEGVFVPECGRKERTKSDQKKNAFKRLQRWKHQQIDERKRAKRSWKDNSTKVKSTLRPLYPSLPFFKVTLSRNCGLLHTIRQLSLTGVSCP